MFDYNNNNNMVQMYIWGLSILLVFGVYYSWYKVKGYYNNTVRPKIISMIGNQYLTKTEGYVDYNNDSNDSNNDRQNKMRLNNNYLKNINRLSNIESFFLLKTNE